MRAVHFLRRRQEERELIFWLSLVAYDHRDRSITNRLYLLYLIIFFSGWIFITLTLFASGGAILLVWLNPADGAQVALDLEIGVLLAWTLYALWQSLKRCPLVFSRQDAALLCQTPVPRQYVTLRWLLMPWFKNAIIFWLISIVLGFSYAETILPEFTGFERVLEYSTFGLRSLIVVVPVHLELFALTWVLGVYRLQKDHNRRWLVWLVLLVTIVFVSIFIIYSIDGSGPLGFVANSIIDILAFPLQAGFGMESLSLSLLSSCLMAMVILVILYQLSGDFNLTRAAQETQEYSTVTAMMRYGLTTEAANLQVEKRLGVGRKPARLPAPAGAGILIWKGVLQARRTFRLVTVFDWLIIFSLMLGLPLLPDIGSRALATAFWAVRIGNLSVRRLRDDLTHWPVLRQLPISYNKLILTELLPMYILLVLISEIGLVLGSLVTGDLQVRLMVLIPVLEGSIAGASAFGVIERSSSDLLMNYSAPEVGLLGTILGLILTFIPLAIETLLPGFVGIALAVLISLALGILAFKLSVRAFRDIDVA